MKGRVMQVMLFDGAHCDDDKHSMLSRIFLRKCSSSYNLHLPPIHLKTNMCEVVLWKQCFTIGELFTSRLIAVMCLRLGGNCPLWNWHH